MSEMAGDVAKGGEWVRSPEPNEMLRRAILDEAEELGARFVYVVFAEELGGDDFHAVALTVQPAKAEALVGELELMGTQAAAAMYSVRGGRLE